MECKTTTVATIVVISYHCNILVPTLVSITVVNINPVSIQLRDGVHGEAAGIMVYTFSSEM